MRPPRRHGFTLVELLVVVAVIMILMALMMPVLQKASGQAERVSCASTLHQWGAGIWAYAASNRQFFPDDRDGQHTSWVGQTVKRFCQSYLNPMGEFGNPERARGDSIIQCPTQRWHRIYGSDYTGAAGTAFGGLNLVGYFYLPHRNVASCDYTPAGNDWVAKTVVTDPPTNAPIMMDMKQWHGDPSLGWFWNASVPFSSHIGKTGEPVGGNFLFLDGAVRWYESRLVELGAVVGAWKMYYKIPLSSR